MAEPPDLYAATLDHLGFERRREQDALVALLRTGGERVAVQAGTGVGKSIAALTHAASLGRPGRPAVLVTMTNALTRQYTLKDAPAVAEATGMTYTRVMGRRHYLCASSDVGVAAVGYEPDTDDPDVLDEWIAKRDRWLSAQGEDAVHDAVRWELREGVHDWRWACPGRCGGHRYGGCGVRRARDRGDQVDVVITNAHCLIYHYRYPLARILPEELAYVLVDEAHQLPDTVSSTLSGAIGPSFGAKWGGEHPATQRQVILPPVRAEDGPDGEPRILLRSHAEVADVVLTGVQALRAEILAGIPWGTVRGPEARIVLTAEQAARALDLTRYYARWCFALATGRYESDEEVAARKEAMAKLAASGEAPAEQEGEPPDEEPGVIDTITLLALTASNPAIVGTVSRTDDQVIRLTRTKVARATARALGPRAALISGTMPPTLPQRVGWADVAAEDVGHPFDYASSVKGWISTWSGVKTPPGRLNQAGRRAWLRQRDEVTDARADELARFIGASGQALVLVPSHPDVAVLREFLGPRLAARGLTGFWQPREGGSQAALAQAAAYREHFERHGGGGVLIGTDSLATGVDMPGPLLAKVAWWCLPIGYTSPADEQRERLYPGFLQDRLRTKVAQGIGRLIRRTEDTGMVLLCDSRFAAHLDGATGILDRHLREIVWKRLPPKPLANAQAGELARTGPFRRAPEREGVA